MADRLRVGIAGASGYGGSELLRLLLRHPHTEVVWAAANEQAGRRVDEVHPNLRSWTDLTLIRFEDADCRALDCLFLALPHGTSPRIVSALPSDLAVIDLGGDFRLRDSEEAERHYGHANEPFVYGLTECKRDVIRQAKRIANPGCFATAALLALHPLTSVQALANRIVIDAKTGSSGSGATVSETTHHPRRSSSFFAYKAFSHRHQPEIRQELEETGWSGRLILQTHSAPLVRGIFATIYTSLEEGWTERDVRRTLEDAYSDSFFIRLTPGSPDVHWVANSNFVDIGWAVEGRDLTLFSAIDNLVKGAAGQAVQNMNLIFGLRECAGLTLLSGNP